MQELDYLYEEILCNYEDKDEEKSEVFDGLGE